MSYADAPHLDLEMWDIYGLLQLVILSETQHSEVQSKDLRLLLLLYLLLYLRQ
jgi:hypothetical protein